MKEIDGLEKVWATGASPNLADYAFVMAHGRGSDVSDMQSMLPTVGSSNIYCVMPRGPLEIMPGRYAWYPFFWNENLTENMRYLNMSFELLDHSIQHLYDVGFKDEQIVLIGHSQGANLLIEYFLANPRPYKALISMRGCVLGNYGDDRDFHNTLPPTLVLLNAGRRDPYIPMRKTDQSFNMMKRLGANVYKVQYEAGHGVHRSELTDLKKLLAKNFNYEE
ncbi:hypothetical protein EP331_11890 [bacterium]|nr:MAG: hypothetical protein EP331_11890 [bacterium]